MTDAASAYAALALDEASSRQVLRGPAAEKTGIAVEHLEMQGAPSQQADVAEDAHR